MANDQNLPVMENLVTKKNQYKDFESYSEFFWYLHQITGNKTRQMK